jgi:hypothetical protein
MVKCGVLFEVRPEFLNNIQTSFGFKGIRESKYIKVKIHTNIQVVISISRNPWDAFAEHSLKIADLSLYYCYRNEGHTSLSQQMWRTEPISDVTPQRGQ